MYTINTTGQSRNPWGLFLGSQLVSSWPNYAAAARALARMPREWVEGAARGAELLARDFYPDAHDADDHDATKCDTCAATDPYMTESFKVEGR